MKKVKKHLIVLLSLLIIVLGICFVLNKKGIVDIRNYSVYIECINENSISSGTGIVYKDIDNKNYIITNYHVIDGYDNIYVYNSNKEKVKATILNRDEYTDLAILVIDDILNLQSATIGNSDNIDIGDKIYTLGNANDIKGLFKIRNGIINNLNKKIDVDTIHGNINLNTIEINSKVDSGNSGGPLLNSKKEVIGVVSVKKEDNAIAYAMPINYVMEIIDKLEDNELNRPNLGAVMTNTTNIELINEYGINEANIRGVILLEVYKSYNYGFQKGDIITRFNNKRINNVDELRKELYKFEKGDNVELKYYRNNKSYKLDIELK